MAIAGGQRVLGAGAAVGQRLEGDAGEVAALGDAVFGSVDARDLERHRGLLEVRRRRGQADAGVEQRDRGQVAGVVDAGRHRVALASGIADRIARAGGVPPPVAGGGNDRGWRAVEDRLRVVADELGAADRRAAAARGIDAGQGSQEAGVDDGRRRARQQQAGARAVGDLQVGQGRTGAAQGERRAGIAGGIGAAGIADGEAAQAGRSERGGGLLDAQSEPVAGGRYLRDRLRLSPGAVVLLAGQGHAVAGGEPVAHHQLRVLAELHHHAVLQRQVRRRQRCRQAGREQGQAQRPEGRCRGGSTPRAHVGWCVAHLTAHPLPRESPGRSCLPAQPLKPAAASSAYGRSMLRPEAVISFAVAAPARATVTSIFSTRSFCAMRDSFSLSASSPSAATTTV